MSVMFFFLVAFGIVIIILFFAVQRSERKARILERQKDFFEEVFVDTWRALTSAVNPIGRPRPSTHLGDLANRLNDNASTGVFNDDELAFLKKLLDWAYFCNYAESFVKEAKVRSANGEIDRFGLEYAKILKELDEATKQVNFLFLDVNNLRDKMEQCVRAGDKQEANLLVKSLWKEIGGFLNFITKAEARITKSGEKPEQVFSETDLLFYNAALGLDNQIDA